MSDGGVMICGRCMRMAHDVASACLRRECAPHLVAPPIEGFNWVHVLWDAPRKPLTGRQRTRRLWRKRGRR